MATAGALLVTALWNESSVSDEGWAAASVGVEVGGAVAVTGTGVAVALSLVATGAGMGTDVTDFSG
eukprot:1181956-Prorocentrum_minimum.AAC.5